MIKVEFAPLGDVSEAELRYAVIVARHGGPLLFVRHSKRTTLEVPGGHIEPGEAPLEAAERELREETGAVRFDIRPVCVYNVRSDKGDSFGVLCRAEVYELGELPESEIGEVVRLDDCPARECLTYPDIQPHLLRRVREWEQDCAGAAETETGRTPGR